MCLKVRDDRTHRLGIVLIGRHGKQVVGIDQARIDRLQGVDNRLERGALSAQGLSAFGVGPDRRLLKLTQDLDEPLLLIRNVKDTP
jgi:hypothetical protein